MTNSAFLGILDEKIKIVNQIEQCSWTDNKIGGYPIFNPAFKVENLLKNNNLRCSNCLEHMAFIIQIYCPVDDSTDERVLYLFSCVNTNCSNQRCSLFRVVTKTTAISESKIFDDWTLTEEENQGRLTQILNNNLNLGENKLDLELYSQFIPHYIVVIDEPNEFINKKYEGMVKTDPISEFDNNEKYEKQYPDVFKDDKSNYKFYKQLRRCPEQILRYEWSGVPLKPSNKSDFHLDTCKYCGSNRIFEFQLMPSLINFLWKNRRKNAASFKLDFETILAFTCSKNCTNSTDNLYEEQIFLFQEDFVIAN